MVVTVQVKVLNVYIKEMKFEDIYKKPVRHVQKFSPKKWEVVKNSTRKVLATINNFKGFHRAISFSRQKCFVAHR